jgi:uncharacterized protein (DUF433 family)
VERVPGKVGGAWVFKGMRVEDFLEWFPGVSVEQARAVLRHAEATLEETTV